MARHKSHQRPEEFGIWYIRYCLRYAVSVLGKKECIKYIKSLNRNGDES
jgi:hypothetical protein